MRVSLRSNPVIQPGQAGEHRKGFSLIEVIVSMVLLAIAVSSLAGLMYSVSRSSIKVTGAAYANGVLMHEVNRLIALPFDSVTNGYTIVSTGPYQHTRVIAVGQPAANVKTVQVVVTPTNPVFKPDTVKLTRTNARTTKVLCTICI